MVAVTAPEKAAVARSLGAALRETFKPKGQRLRVGVGMVLLALIAMGLGREFRVRRLLAPVLQGLDGRNDQEAIELIAHRIGTTVKDINLHGRREPPWPRPFRTPTAALVVGGTCGDAALAMGAAMDQLGLNFRILLTNVKHYGASHVMVEVETTPGRWLVADALEGHLMRHPGTSEPLTLDQLRALSSEDAHRLPLMYQPEQDWSVFARNERTIWESYGWPGLALSRLLGPERSSTVSLRAMWIEPGDEIALAAALGLLALFINGLRSAQRA